MKNQPRIVTARYVIGSLILAGVAPLLPLLISRHWDWWQAWVYAIIMIFGFVITRWLAAQRHPDILAERGRIMQQKDAKYWDKLLAPLVILSFDVILVVAGLDELLNLSPKFNLPVTVLSLLIVLAGYIFGSYALIENRYFSGMARIQTDRGHQIVTSGPYAWVRHPGYAGSLLTFIATPFCLESWWACAPLLLTTVALLIRTHLEDTMLQNELPGYHQYAQRVRYRLVPGLW